MKISVIISVFSRERLPDLLRCIKSLKKQTTAPEEIIVVLEPNEHIITFFKSFFDVADVKVVVSDGPGLSCARNSGIKAAKGEIIVFIDDDAFADEKWLEMLTKNYEDVSVIGVGGNIIPAWSCPPFWFPQELNWIVGCSYEGLPKVKSSIRNPIGCNMSFRQSVFKKVGFFRSNVGRFGKRPISGEEADFSIRALDKYANSKILFEPTAVVFHSVPIRRISLKYLFQRSFYEGYSKAIVTQSNSNIANSLSTEQQYVLYLLKTFLPVRFGDFFKVKKLCKLVIIFSSAFSVLLGYLTGKLILTINSH